MERDKAPLEANESELTEALSHPPANGVARARFSTGVLQDLRAVATEKEIATMRAVVDDAQHAPTPRAAWKLSLLVRIIERVKEISHR